MQGRTRRCRLSGKALFLLALLPVLLGARYRTENFEARARSAELAKAVALQAEAYRTKHAKDWLGYKLPAWRDRCVIDVTPCQMPPNGATSYAFVGRGEFAGSMEVKGSVDRILDSVIPHEVLHTVLASHFKRQLPRWVDEGAATMCEHVSERGKQRKMLYSFLKSGRGIAFSEMFRMMDYPRDQSRILPLYAQSYSLAEWMLQQKDKQTYVRFIEDAFATNSWTKSLQKHYDIESVGQLQNEWLAWVRAGSQLPADRGFGGPSDTRIAAAGTSRETMNIHPVSSVDRSKARITNPANVASASPLTEREAIIASSNLPNLASVATTTTTPNRTATASLYETPAHAALAPRDDTIVQASRWEAATGTTKAEHWRPFGTGKASVPVKAENTQAATNLPERISIGPTFRQWH